MFDEPPCPDSDALEATRLGLSEGKVVAYVNPPALAFLLWQFWYLAAKSSRGDEMSLSNTGDLLDIPDCSPLGYCEITMVGEGPVMGRLHNPVAEFLHREPRVDLFVNRLQAERGYESLQRLGGTEAGGRVEQVELFGRLIIRLLPLNTLPREVADWEAMVDSFDGGDVKDHQETLAALEKGLDEDRPGQRRVFGMGDNPPLL